MKNLKFILIPSSLVAILFYIYSYFLFPEYLDEVPGEFDAINGYKKNAWTSQKSTSDNNYYNYTYKFKDLSNQTHIWKWSAPKKESDEIIKRFGVPPSIYKPYVLSPEVIAKRNKQIKAGYYRAINNLVIPDYTAIVDASRPLVAGLASLVKKTAKADALSSRETIELLMSFCQDIPYGIPPNNYKNKVISGMFPPPLALNKTWGDCDTKAILFAATYLSLPGTSIALLESPGHVSIGVEGIPGPYDNAVNYGRKKYIFAEPVGPGKHPLGHAVSPYVQVKMVYPIKLKGELIQPKLPVISESISLGNNVILSLKDGNTSIADKVKLFYNHVGQNKTYYELTSRPRKDGTIKYSTEKNIIFLMINEAGYYHYGSYDIRKNSSLDLNFSEGNCIYIKTRPRKKVFLFRHKNGKYSGLQFQADNRGIVRAIMESGEYVASVSQKISGGLKQFNREKKIGITFSL